MDRILIVDDNSKNIQVLATVLTKNGFEVEYSLRGKDAIEIAKGENFDLILLDIMMPEMDGFETCEQLKKIENKQDIPIIFLTAKTDIESITKGFEIGGVDYITKPFNDKELLKRIHTHLELKKSKEKLKEVNVWLEKQVEERTKELNEAKIELENLNKDLLKVDEAKTNFLSLISHEIRTPLNGISGFLYLLKKQNKIEGLEKYINPLDSSVKRLEEFSDKALLLTKIIAYSKEELNMKVLNLRELTLFAISNLSLLIDQKGINLKIDDIPENITINGNDDFILKSLEFVIENAIEFSPENGEIRINVIDSEKKVVCEVIDSGKGFAPEVIKNAFQLFSPDDHVNKNYGISLSIVKKVMEKHDGDITLENTDTGAKVSLIFQK